MDDLKSNLAQSYISMMENLSSETKREIISGLSNSLKRKRRKKKSLMALCGAFESNLTPEEFAKELRKARAIKRKTVKF